MQKRRERRHALESSMQVHGICGQVLSDASGLMLAARIAFAHRHVPPTALRLAYIISAVGTTAAPGPSRHAAGTHVGGGPAERSGHMAGAALALPDLWRTRPIL